MHLLYYLMQVEVFTKLRDGDGRKMIYATNEKLCEELVCSERTISRARNVILDRGWVTIKINQSLRRSYFIILWENLGPALGVAPDKMSTLGRQNDDPALTKCLPSVDKMSTPLPINSFIKKKKKRKKEESAASTNLFGDKLPEKQNQYIPNKYEMKILTILQGIKKYPFDLETDLKQLRAWEQKYPKVDIEASAMKMAADYLDTPIIPKKDRPRRKLLTYISNAHSWGKDQLPEKPRGMEPRKSPLAEGRGYTAEPEAEPGRFVDMNKPKERR